MYKYEVKVSTEEQRKKTTIQEKIYTIKTNYTYIMMYIFIQLGKENK